MSDLETMTVGDLKNLLEGYGDDTPVVMAAASHNHWSTTLANPLAEHDCSMRDVVYSDYNRQHIVPEEDDDDEREVTHALVLGDY